MLWQHYEGHPNLLPAYFDLLDPLTSEERLRAEEEIPAHTARASKASFARLPGSSSDFAALFGEDWANSELPSLGILGTAAALQLGFQPTEPRHLWAAKPRYGREGTGIKYFARSGSDTSRNTSGEILRGGVERRSEVLDWMDKVRAPRAPALKITLSTTNRSPDNFSTVVVRTLLRLKGYTD